jgi:hypothetical protein
MASLIAPPAGANPTSTAAGLIDSVLASGAKSGYSLTYSSGAPDANGHINSFSFSANPLSNSTGTQYYFVDGSGVIRQNSTAAAGSTDSPVGG